MNTMRKIRWFWSWNDEKEEQWLREMSAQGWHLKEVENPFFYIFEEGNPAEFVYRLDFLATRIDESEYQQIFEDAGWAYLGVKRGWRYFRQKATADSLPEIYTDNESKVKKIQRTMGYQLFSLFVILGYGFLYTSWGPAELTLSLFIIISLIFAYSLVRLWLRMRQLSA